MSLIDSVVFRDIFGTEPTRRVWSDGNRTQRYLDIEAALVRAEATVGIIPAEAAAGITKQARVREAPTGNGKDRLSGPRCRKDN
jgi:3-carboxy-cis,cis-muconate cycloisomerase